MLQACQISIRPARYSTWLFLFFKWSNFSPCWILWNWQRNVTLGAMAFLSNACQQQVDFMDSWAIVLPKFTGKLSPIEKTLRNTNLTGNDVDQISLSASSTRDVGSRLLKLPNENAKARKKSAQKRNDWTGLPVPNFPLCHSLFSSFSEACCEICVRCRESRRAFISKSASYFLLGFLVISCTFPQPAPCPWSGRPERKEYLSP